MSLERVFAWAVVLAVGGVVAFAATAPPTPSAQLVVAALGVLVVFPLAFVAVGWLYTVGISRLRSR